MLNQNMSVYVVGAGIIGLPTALRILEIEPRAKVTLVAEKFGDDTTSAIAAGWWRPSYLTDENDNNVIKWSQSTYEFMGQLFREDSVKYGTGRISGYELYHSREPTPAWADFIPDFRRPSTKELEHFGWGNYKEAFFYTSYYLESKLYLPVLMERFLSQGGIVQKRRLDSLHELDGQADVIVNCTGLGSYHLLGDRELFPVRGQVFKVRAPFIKHFVSTDYTYILPNHGVITLGGTSQYGDWNTTVDKNDSIGIWERTTTLWPALKHATILGDYVGLRPGRSSIRLETENMIIGNTMIPVVHNYGHGGSGVTLHHGCALDAAHLAKKAIHMKAIAAKL